MNITSNSASGGGQNTVTNDLWIRLPHPRGGRFWGLSRTTILEMCERGEVKSTVIKKKHAMRGIRLIYLPSLQAALEKLAEGGDK
jgi:hypothetical protein